MKRASLGGILLWSLVLTASLAADAGVLIPSSKKRVPDPAILSLEEMQVRIRVDHRLMRVQLTQYYANHVDAILEGTYVFSFPPGASLSDFAIWDGVTRIPGVVLEKRKAAEIYRELASQAIDPGLLQMGEAAESSEIPSGYFTVKVAPIPPFGYKRVELEYQQALPVTGGQVAMYLPLRSRIFPNQNAAKIGIDLEIEDGRPIEAFSLLTNQYPLPWTQPAPTRVEGRWEGRKVLLSEDFGFRWRVDAAQPSGVFLTWRGRESDLRAGHPVTAIDAPAKEEYEDGYFLLDQLFPARPGAAERAPLTAVLVADTSLSMWWGKLRQAEDALKAYTAALRPADQFNLVLFNEAAKPVFPAPVPASPENVRRAFDAFYAAYLSGGTDPVPALEEAVRQANAGTNPEKCLVLIGDWMPTVGTLRNAAVLKKAEPLLKGKPLRVHGVLTGDDANKTLLDTLATWTDGQVLWLGERDTLEEELAEFAGHLGQQPYGDLQLETPGAAFYQVYPAHPVSIFAATTSAWVGRYKPEAGTPTVTLRGQNPDRSPFEAKIAAPLPEQDLRHPLLPRFWARARVDFLVDKINREGEDAASIREIIALAQKFKFVTPYTSFLAAPRSLLRPRIIQPRDPVLRIQADPSIVAASVQLPWGEVLPLDFLPAAGVWQTRFFVPGDVPDGTHRCLVLLRDRAGQLFREEKSFVIDSVAPAARWLNPVAEARPGAALALRVDAPPDTRTLTASLEGAGRVALRWDAAAGCCTGTLVLPPGSPPGGRRLTLLAEDIAHNVYRKDYAVRILP
jgi:Ca-activated chloride channel family protein